MTDVFGIMGSGNFRLIHCLTHELGIAFHAARHEAGAVSAADGYYRATGRIGVSTVTQGPGLTNTLTPLITARKANTSMVLLTGDSSTARSPTDPFAGVQDVSWSAFFETADVEAIRTTRGTVAADVQEAFDRASRLSRPVAIVMPYEFVSAQVDRVAPPSPRSTDAEEPDPAALDAAADRLRNAARPLILAGRGAVRAEAGAALRELADRLQALLGTSLPATGFFHGHPGDLGIVGGYSRASVQAAVNTCDCVFVAGASLNDYTTNKQSLLRRCHVIHADRDPAAFGRFRAPDSTITGDARRVAEALLERIGPANPPRATAHRDPVVAVALSRPRHEPFTDRSSHDGLDPRALCIRLDTLLPPDRTVVTDGGRFASHVIRNVVAKAPQSLLHMQDFGSVGSGLGAAIGAAVGLPDRLTVLFIGDCGMLMTLGDLDLAIRERIPILIVCMNDQALGSEITLLTNAGLDIEDALMGTPDFETVVTAMGAQGRTIRSIDQLDEVPVLIRELTVPLVLDCRIMKGSIPP